MREELLVFGMKGLLEPFTVRCLHYRIQQNYLWWPLTGKCRKNTSSVN